MQPSATPSSRATLGRIPSSRDGQAARERVCGWPFPCTRWIDGGGAMSYSVHDSSRVGNGLNIAMGVWLVLSAFAWPHDAEQRLNAVMIGSAIAALGAVALMWRPASWVAALPAVWLFGTALFADHQHAPTPWNNVAVAVVVFMAATAPLAASPTYGGRVAER